MCSLELSLASQASLPSVGSSSPSEARLCEEVFNILPGTVSQCRGAAQYNSQDQPFSFQKQVRFKDNTSSPNLKPNADPKKQSSQPMSSIYQLCQIYLVILILPLHLVELGHYCIIGHLMLVKLHLYLVILKMW